MYQVKLDSHESGIEEPGSEQVQDTVTARPRVGERHLVVDTHVRLDRVRGRQARLLGRVARF